MKYPRWFPYPRCWLRAHLNWLGLMVWGFIFMVMLFPVTSSLTIFGMMSGIEILAGASGWGFALVVLFALWLVLILPAIVMGYIRQVGESLRKALKSRSAPKSVKPSFSYWMQGFGDFAIAILALILCLPIFALDQEYHYSNQLSDEVISLIVLSNLTIQAYCYQARNLVQESGNRRQAKLRAAEQRREVQRQNRARRQVTQRQKLEKRRKRDEQRRKPKPMHPFPEEFGVTTKPVSPGSIEAELENMRWKIKLGEMENKEHE